MWISVSIVQEKKPHPDYKLWIKDDKEFEMNRLIVLEEYRNTHLVLELPMIYCVYKKNNNEMLDDIECYMFSNQHTFSREFQANNKPINSTRENTLRS